MLSGAPSHVPSSLAGGERAAVRVGCSGAGGGVRCGERGAVSSYWLEMNPGHCSWPRSARAGDHPCGCHVLGPAGRFTALVLPQNGWVLVGHGHHLCGWCQVCAGVLLSLGAV